MDDAAQTSRWGTLCLALRERAEAARVNIAAIPPAPCGAASLRAFSEALEKVANQGGWFDKRAFDEELAACGASDGRLHLASEWSFSEWEYPDDPSPMATTREFGIQSIRRGLVSAQFRPDHMGTGSDAARVYMEYAEELLGELRRIRVERNANKIAPLTWGGPPGDAANRERHCRAFALGRVRATSTLPGAHTQIEYAAGDEILPAWFDAAPFTLEAGKFSSHEGWVASIGQTFDCPFSGIFGPYWYGEQFDGEVWRDDPDIRVAVVGVRGRTAVPTIGRTIAYPIMEVAESHPVVDPGLVADEEPDRFEFTAPCAGRLLLHASKPCVRHVGRSGGGYGGIVNISTFDGGVYTPGWNSFAVQEGVNVLYRPPMPRGPSSWQDVRWRAGDGFSVAGQLGTETVGCVIDEIVFEPIFTHLAP